MSKSGGISGTWGGGGGGIEGWRTTDMFLDLIFFH